LDRYSAAFIFAVTPMMVLTLVDPVNPHPLVRAAVGGCTVVEFSCDP
jgi:hypothetical protein